MQKHVFSLTFIVLAGAFGGGEVAAEAKKSSAYCKEDSGVEMGDVSSEINEAFGKKMAQIGVSVIARYYDYPNETLPGKRLRSQELDILRRHGLQLLVVFQHKNNKAATFINWKTRGPEDARESIKLAKLFSQPQSSAIYFGVDGDFVGKGKNFYTEEVKSYFKEINRVFAQQGKSYRIGMYGSGAACDMLRDAGLVKLCWISHSHGFVGTKGSLAAGRYDIEQYLPGICGGMSLDFGKFRKGLTEVGQFSP